MQRAITLWKSVDSMSNVQDRVVACLHAMFDDVLAERLPDELSTLLEELARAEGANQEGGDEAHSVTPPASEPDGLLAVRKR
ncbi:MAG: hypothetical protein C5B56_14760 [Proteobacteria bacterium]|nr:MAG: hypothetical protein C5B56_14760 [Pseudomonadota bacterium]